MSQLTKTRASEILRAFRDRNVLVLGDVMLDEFVWGDVTRISPEAPVPVVDVRRESVHLGGAANVLANLVALGARGSVVGVVGKDGSGERLRTGLRELGTLDQGLIVDETRPSTTGTGASGEMRVTSPQTNSSSITSPSTSTLRSRKARSISEARVLVS